MFIERLQLAFPFYIKLVIFNFLTHIAPYGIYHRQNYRKKNKSPFQQTIKISYQPPTKQQGCWVFYKHDLSQTPHCLMFSLCSTQETCVQWALFARLAPLEPSKKTLLLILPILINTFLNCVQHLVNTSSDQTVATCYWNNTIKRTLHTYIASIVQLQLVVSTCLKTDHICSKCYIVVGMAPSDLLTQFLALASPTAASVNRLYVVQLHCLPPRDRKPDVDQLRYNDTNRYAQTTFHWRNWCYFLRRALYFCIPLLDERWKSL